MTTLISTFPVRVYWEDTDAGGVVYHASYLRFMERARTELLREHDIHQSTLQQHSGVTFVVAEMNIRFRQSAKLDDELHVLTFAKLRHASLVLEQKIFRSGGGEPLLEAEVTCAVISREGKPVRLPADVKEKLESRKEPEGVPYYELPGLETIYLEDSYVLAIDETPDRFTIDLDCVLTEKDPDYRPPEGEKYCFKRLRLEFSPTERVVWPERTFSWSTDASGEKDLGNIDSFEKLEDGTYELTGGWGVVRIKAGAVRIIR